MPGSARPSPARGDVDGDGLCDVIVGAPHYELDDTSYNGRAFVYFGMAGGLRETAAWMTDGPLFSAFGTSVSSAGDVDGDGFSDVVVGAPSEAANRFGLAFAYRGGPQGLATQPAWTFQDDYFGTALGQSVAAAGDVNLDGFGDVIVGAPYRNDRAVLGLRSIEWPQHRARTDIVWHHELRLCGRRCGRRQRRWIRRRPPHLLYSVSRGPGVAPLR